MLTRTLRDFGDQSSVLLTSLRLYVLTLYSLILLVSITITGCAWVQSTCPRLCWPYGQSLLSQRNYRLSWKVTSPQVQGNPYYIRYKIHERWLLLWINFIVILCVTTPQECFKMQMAINLAPVSLSNKKWHSTLDRDWLTEEKCHANCLKQHFWVSKFKFLWEHTFRPTKRSIK